MRKAFPLNDVIMDTLFQYENGIFGAGFPCHYLVNPVYRGWLFLSIRTPPPPPPVADFCSCDNFRTTLQISYICWQGWWTWCIDYVIGFWSILVVTLIFNFHGQIWLSAKMVRLSRNKKQNYRLNFRTQMWPSGLTLTMTLNFQDNLLYLNPKWSECYETKCKHIDWSLRLICDQRVWPSPWPWHWIFTVKCGICYIFWQNDPITTKRKMNYRLNTRPQV